jgi:hypothetical protein
MARPRKSTLARLANLSRTVQKRVLDAVERLSLKKKKRKISEGKENVSIGNIHLTKITEKVLGMCRNHPPPS